MNVSNYTTVTWITSLYNYTAFDAMETIANRTNDKSYSPLDGFIYEYVPPLMLILCLVSLVINTRVLVAVKWTRRPLSPNLFISLSLAAADACTSLLLGIGLLINSYLPQVFEIEVACKAELWIEMFRLSGIIVTVCHLLALSINHWLGILKPLHYATLVTGSRITYVTVLLWVVPVAFFAIYFSFQDDGCAVAKEDDYNDAVPFYDRVSFRVLFMSLFLVPFSLMIYCYSHIFRIVRKQQRVWSHLSRSGSKRNKGGTVISTPPQQRLKTIEDNIKALYTMLLILGSYVIGWLPAIIIFILICPEGCLYKQSDFSKVQLFFMGIVANVLIILKTLVNPIIYSTRMIEIREGMQRMELVLARRCCQMGRRKGRGRTINSQSNNEVFRHPDRGNGYYYRRPLVSIRQNYGTGGSAAAVCHMDLEGSSSAASSARCSYGSTRRVKYSNTFV